MQWTRELHHKNQCLVGQNTVAQNMYIITFSITYETLFVSKLQIWKTLTEVTSDIFCT